MCDPRRPSESPVPRSIALLVIALSALSCSHTTAPQNPVTLRVSNASCGSGGCVAVHAVGFPSDAPQTPGGMWYLDLGTDSAATFCLSILRSGTFQVTAVDQGGTSRTTTYNWSDGDSLSLGTLAVGESPLTATPSTPAFVPRSSAGWGVSLPGTSAVTPAAPCDGS